MRLAVGLIAAAALLHGSAGFAAGYVPCVAERPDPMAVTDAELCRRLDRVVGKPSALPLDRYEEALSQYSTHFCYRNEAAGWVRDKHIRATGPRVARLAAGKWTAANFGTHAQIVIWYSPEMAAWMRTNRPAERSAPANPPPPPDGAIMVKEIYTQPASACRDVDPLMLFPLFSTMMIRDGTASRDGWFWADYAVGGRPDWPPAEGSPAPTWASRKGTASTATPWRKAMPHLRPARTLRASPVSR